MYVESMETGGEGRGWKGRGGEGRGGEGRGGEGRGIRVEGRGAPVKALQLQVMDTLLCEGIDALVQVAKRSLWTRHNTRKSHDVT